MPVIRVKCRPRWMLESPLDVLPGPLLAGGVDNELAVHGVADLSFRRSDRFFRALALVQFALVVGPTGGVVADLGDGGDVQGVDELSVATLVEAVPFDRALTLRWRRWPAWPMMIDAPTGPTPYTSVTDVFDAETAMAI